MTQKGSSLRLFIVLGSMLMAFAVDHKFLTKCSPDIRLGIIEVENPNQQFVLNLSNNFKYVQISMKIEACYSHNIYRGNRFLSGKLFNVSNTELVGIPMNVSYREINGTHTYLIAIKTRSIKFSDVIDTSIKCGRYHGFRVKAVGATICTIQEQNDVDMMSRMSKSSISDTDLSKRIDDLHRWATGAYLMAICFSLTVYGVVLVAQMYQRRKECLLDERVQPIVLGVRPHRTIAFL